MTVERYRLDNGLQVLLQPDTSAPVLCFETWFAVGSRHEKLGKTGLAHLLEHLMFNETSHHPHGEYDRLLEAAGAENNAATYLDWTYYMVNAPSEALPLVIELESDRMQHLVLREDHVARERDVVANERRQTVDDDVDGKLNELLYTNSFSRHAYRFPTIGTMADIQGLTTDDCRRFYETYYAPNNATLVVVGDVDTEAVIGLIEEAYGHMAHVDIPEESPCAEPLRERPTEVSATLPSATAKLAVAYPSPAMSSADHVVLELVNEVMFGGRASRAHRKLVHDMECAQDVYAYVGPFRDPSLYEMHVTARQGVGSQQLLAGIDEVLDSLQRCPITAADLRRARSRLELDALQGMDSVTGRAEQIGFCEVVLGDPGALFDRLGAYAAVTPERAMTVAQKYLRTERRTVVQIEPAAAEAAP